MRIRMRSSDTPLPFCIIQFPSLMRHIYDKSKNVRKGGLTSNENIYLWLKMHNKLFSLLELNIIHLMN